MAEGALRTEPASDPDGLYELLVDAHRDLTVEHSQALSLRLVLLLANHIGDPAVIREAVDLARAGPGGMPGDPMAMAGVMPRE